MVCPFSLLQQRAKVNDASAGQERVMANYLTCVPVIVFSFFVLPMHERFVVEERFGDYNLDLMSLITTVEVYSVIHRSFGVFAFIR
jgi:hypothetical protein